MQGLKASTLRPQCPLWVISGHFAMAEVCPLYPRKRTLIGGMECPLCANSEHTDAAKYRAASKRSSVPPGDHRGSLLYHDDCQLNFSLRHNFQFLG